MTTNDEKRTVAEIERPSTVCASRAIQWEQLLACGMCLGQANEKRFYPAVQFEFFLATATYNEVRLQVKNDVVSSYFHFDLQASTLIVACASRILRRLGLQMYIQDSFAILAEREA